jgi:hypothetical protein
MALPSSLPSRRVLTLGIVLAAGVFAVWWLVHTQINSTPTPSDTLTIAGDKDKGYQPYSPSDDPDGDGLSTWKEIMVGTDPYQPDTDHDGTDDRTEIIGRRDPIKAGPNDELDQGDARLAAFANLAVGTSTRKTDQAFDLLFPTALSLADNQVDGAPANNADYQAVAAAVADQVSEEYPSHTTADLNIDPKVSSQAYPQQLATLVQNQRQNHAASMTTSELELVSRLAGGNKDALTELDAHITFYQGLLNQLLKMQINPARATTHLSLINNYEHVIAAIGQMEKISSDPLAGALGLEAYQQLADQNAALFENIFQEL